MAALRARAGEQLERLSQKLDEKRGALEKFLAVKREEESKVQAGLKVREAERQELAGRLARLPQKLEEALAQRKQAAAAEAARIKTDIAALEKTLAAARE
jgi:hypothetical protein